MGSARNRNVSDWLMIAGAVLFIIGAALYRSYEHRVILGRWSVPFFCVLVIASLGTIAAARYAYKRRMRISPALLQDGNSETIAGAAVACLGLSYFLEAVHDPDAGGRIVALNLFGAVYPPATALSWIAMGLFSTWVLLMAWKRLGGRYPNAVATVAGLVLALIVAEGGLRLLATTMPTTQGVPTYRGKLWEERYVRLNHEGFRDADHRLARPLRGHRVLIVGDSVAFGTGVDLIEDRFGEQLRRILDQRTGGPWEVVNASRPDTHTLDHIEFLKRMLRYEPDIVILLYVFNDIDYLSHVTPRDLVTQAPLTLVDRFNPVRLSYKNSYLAQEVYVRARAAYYGILKPRRADHDAYEDATLVDEHLKDIKRFVSLANGAGAVVVVAPYHLGLARGGVGVDYRWFLDQVQRREIPLLPLYRAFDGIEQTRLTVNSLDAHPNPLANRLAAELAADELLGLDGGLAAAATR